MAKSNELMTNSTESLLLCLLADKPMYGYQLIKELKDRSQGYFNFKEGTLYPALHRLDTAGLIEGSWRMLPSGQQRRYYNITEKGLAGLAKQRGHWHDFITAMNLIISPVKG